MRPIFLVVGTDDSVLRRPKISDHLAFKCFDKEVLQSWGTKTEIDHVQGVLVDHKALQAIRYYPYTPDRFVRWELCLK